MLDIKFIKENQKAVAQNIKDRGSKLDLAKLLKVSDTRSDLLGKVEKLRSERKQSAKPTPAEIEKIKKTTAELDKMESELAKVEEQYRRLMLELPNMHSDDTPIGKDESENKEVRKVGKPTKFEFKPKDHLELTEPHGWIDFERGAKVSGAKFYYTRGPIAQLEQALMRYALDIVTKRGYELVNPPLLIKHEILEGKGVSSEEELGLNVYKVEEEDLYLAGTGEIPLIGMHAGEILRDLPIKYVAFTPCFRREAGTYGRHAKGLYRVHQFWKLEMFQYTTVDQSDKALDEMVAIEEEILSGLGLAYRVTQNCSGDMAGYLTKQFDPEYYSPVDESYREIMSAGNAGDFQARRLGIKYQNGKDKEYVHTLNATVAALSRLVIAVLENYQQKDGSIKVPEALVPYFGAKEIKG